MGDGHITGVTAGRISLRRAAISKEGDELYDWFACSEYLHLEPRSRGVGAPAAGISLEKLPEAIFT